jgi:hypothetical protein
MPRLAIDQLLGIVRKVLGIVIQSDLNHYRRFEATLTTRSDTWAHLQKLRRQHRQIEVAPAVLFSTHGLRPFFVHQLRYDASATDWNPRIQHI